MTTVSSKYSVSCAYHQLSFLLYNIPCRNDTDTRNRNGSLWEYVSIIFLTLATRRQVLDSVAGASNLPKHTCKIHAAFTCTMPLCQDREACSDQEIMKAWLAILGFSNGGLHQIHAGAYINLADRQVYIYTTTQLPTPKATLDNSSNLHGAWPASNPYTASKNESPSQAREAWRSACPRHRSPKNNSRIPPQAFDSQTVHTQQIIVRLKNIMSWCISRLTINYPTGFGNRQMSSLWWRADISTTHPNTWVYLWRILC